MFEKDIKKRKFHDSGGRFQHTSHHFPLGKQLPLPAGAWRVRSVSQLVLLFLLPPPDRTERLPLHPSFRPQAAFGSRVWGPRVEMVLAGGRAEGKGASEDQTRGSSGLGLWKNHQGDSSALNRHSQKRATEPNHTCGTVIYDGSGHPRFETTFLPHPGHVLTRPQNV